MGIHLNAYAYKDTSKANSRRTPNSKIKNKIFLQILNKKKLPDDSAQPDLFKKKTLLVCTQKKYFRVKKAPQKQVRRYVGI